MPGTCEGEAYCDDIDNETDCTDCGCEWDFGMCFPDEIDCGNLSEYYCEDCGCDWVPEPVGPENVDINVGDVWKDVEEIKINVGDVWRTVTEIHINVGDVWKSVYVA